MKYNIMYVGTYVYIKIFIINMQIEINIIDMVSAFYFTYSIIFFCRQITEINALSIEMTSIINLLCGCKISCRNI